MATTHTITGSIADWIPGVDPRRVRAVAYLNIPASEVVVEDSGTVWTASKAVNIDATLGTFAAELLATDATDLNVEPDTLRWTIQLSVVDQQTRLVGQRPQADRRTVTLGPFPVTADGNIGALTEHFDTPAVSPQWRSTFAAEMEGIKNEVQSYVIGELGTTDSQAATLISTPGTLTEGALSAAIADSLDSPNLTGVPTVNGVPIANADIAPILVPNHDFEAAIPTGDSTTLTNWRLVDGTTKARVQVPDGPKGTTTHVLRFTDTTSVSSVVIAGLQALGYAGKTMEVVLVARARVNGAISVADARVTVQDTADTVRLNQTTFKDGIPVTWTRTKIDVAVPAATNSVTLMLGARTAAGSGRIEYDSVLFRPKAPSLTEAAETAVAGALGPELEPIVVGVVDSTLATRPEPTPIPAQAASFSKGTVGTDGRAPISIRFDDWWDDFKALGFHTELRDRGLPWSAVWCSQLGSNPWNSTITYDDLRLWVKEYGCEVWSHGTNHQSPHSTNPATFTANITREIVQSKADIEAQGVRCVGFALPGVPGNGYGFSAPNVFNKWSDYDSESGRLLRRTYGLIETDVTGYYRTLPSDARYGLSHNTVSDGMTMAEAYAYIDGAINTGQGFEFMCHTGNLGDPGNITVANFLELLDYLVTKRDAGLIEVVTPSSLVFANPDSARRLDLIGNGDFTNPVPVNNFTVFGNWRAVKDDAVSKVVGVSDGPGAAPATVLRTGTGSLAYQAHTKAVAMGWAGNQFMLDAWVRGAGSPATWRLRASNPALTHVDAVDLQGTAPTTWTRVRRCFAAPIGLQDLALFFSAQSGTVEWSDVHVWIA